MTLAELFVKISLKFDGGKQVLDTVQKGMKDAESRAIKLSFAVDAVVGAMTGLMYFSANAAVGLQKFGVMSGVSTDALQDWQYAAAKFNVSGQAVADTILNIQTAQAQIRLTGQGVGPWQFLGIDPRLGNPLDVLWKLHLALQRFSPAVGRLMASQMGVGAEMFTFLARPDLHLGELEKKFMVSPEQIDKLAELSGQFERIKQKTKALGMELAVNLAPAFHDIFNELQPLLEKGAKWLAWLGGGTDEAKAKREQLTQIAEAAVHIGVALAAVVVASKALSAISILASPFGAGLIALAAAADGIMVLYNALHTKQDAASITASQQAKNDGIIPNGRGKSFVNSRLESTNPAYMGGAPEGSALAAIADSINKLWQHVLPNTWTTTININGGDPAKVKAAVMGALDEHKKKLDSATADQIFPALAPASP